MQFLFIHVFIYEYGMYFVGWYDHEAQQADTFLCYSGIF